MCIFVQNDLFFKNTLFVQDVLENHNNNARKYEQYIYCTQREHITFNTEKDIMHMLCAETGIY